MSLTTKVKVAKFSLLNEKSYNKTVIDFSVGRHKDLPILKSDIHLGLAASVNYHFFVLINPYAYLIEVNNCIIFHSRWYLSPSRWDCIILLVLTFVYIYLEQAAV